MHTSIYNTFEDHYKTSILPAAIHLKTADGSPMSLMVKVTLHLYIADLKFLHTLFTCDKLPETDLLCGINLQKRNLLYYCWVSDRQLFIQREGSFLTYTRNKEQHRNITIIKSILKIPARYNDAIPIKIKGYNLRDHMAYFISNQHTKKGLDPNIHVNDGIHNIKGKLTIHVIVANSKNKHITFNKGQCIGHMEPHINIMP